MKDHANSKSFGSGKKTVKQLWDYFNFIGKILIFPFAFIGTLILVIEVIPYLLSTIARLLEIAFVKKKL